MLTKDQFNVLLDTATADVQKADDDAAAKISAQAALDSATAQAQRSSAQAATSSAACLSGLQELLTIAPTPPPVVTPPPVETGGSDTTTPPVAVGTPEL